jgi:multidrug transporter EmrE-like cation transporter
VLKQGKAKDKLMPLIVVTYVVSKVFYKEELTKTQFAGFLTGLASIVFLNI